MHTTVDIYTVDRLTEREETNTKSMYIYIYVQYELKWCGDYKSI